MGFHAPREAVRVPAESINYARLQLSEQRPHR